MPLIFKSSPKKRTNIIPDGPAQARDRGLDETLSDTFPCSDPLSSIPDPQVESPTITQTVDETSGRRGAA